MRGTGNATVCALCILAYSTSADTVPMRGVFFEIDVK
jgi:hypothetical protein